MKRMMVIIFVGLMLVVSSCQSNNIPPETSQPVVPSESSVLSTSNEEEPLSYELLHEDGVDGWIRDDYFSVWVKMDMSTAILHFQSVTNMWTKGTLGIGNCVKRFSQRRGRGLFNASPGLSAFLL